MELQHPDSEMPAMIENRKSKSKTSTRMRYEAEVLFLKRQNGDLEQIREKLGLSRRKICQLLLVDPSAWTRWTQEGGEAPPHIYRALDWYISILEKDPEYRRLANRFGQWLNQEKDHEGRLRQLEDRLARTQVQPAKTLRQWLPLGLALLGVLMIVIGFVFQLR